MKTLNGKLTRVTNMRSVFVIFLVVALSCSKATSKPNLNERYNSIMDLTCDFSGEEVERNVVWECIKAKTDKMKKFQLDLDQFMISYLESRELDKKSYELTRAEWTAYVDSMNDFFYDFHITGSGGTEYRLKSEQHLAKQRIDHLMYLLLEFYEIDSLQ